MALVNPSTGTIKNWSWASGGCSILAEIGTMHLEFSELSHYFNEPKYLEKVMHIRKTLKNMDRPGKPLKILNRIKNYYTVRFSRSR
jgi:mannosyl-oligosaccharide alpha-1,2-mannosidase